jgi:hypothetical protein
MQRVLLLLAAGAAFALGPLAASLGPVAGAALALSFGIALALAASGARSAVAAAAGAMGAFAATVMTPASPAIGGAVLLGFAYAERTARVRGTGSAGRALPRLAHIGVALGAGALAGTIGVAYAGASVGVRGVAVVVAAVLAALPLLIDADDPVAHELDRAAAAVSDPARAKLREGAELRRQAGEELLDARSARQVKRTWRALVRLAEARCKLERAATTGASSQAERVRALLDDRIAAHVAVLCRAYLAVDAARGAEATIDDAALRSVESVGESLEQVSDALVEEA